MWRHRRPFESSKKVSKIESEYSPSSEMSPSASCFLNIEASKAILSLSSEVKAGFAGIEQQMVTIFNTLTEISHTLNGNGREGLVERVRALEERLNGTWKILLIIGWIFNFLVAVGAVAAAILIK